MTTTIERLSTSELIASVQDLNIDEGCTPEGRNAARLAYRATVTGFEIQWELWLREQYLPGAPSAISSKLFNLAWVQSHADGYGAVETTYIDLADLARSVHENWV